MQHPQRIEREVFQCKAHAAERTRELPVVSKLKLSRLRKECVELPSARWRAISQKQGYHRTRVGVERIGWVAVGRSEGG